MIKAVFFDFGGVILSSPFDAFASLEQRSGLPEGFIRTVNATNPDSNAWARLERSELGLDEFARAFEAEAAELGHEVDGDAVLACLDGELRPEMVEVVRRCSDAFTTGLLTNNFLTTGSGDGRRDVDEGSRRAFDGRFSEVLSMFDVIVESSRLGVRKPDRAFYDIACERAEVRPDQVVFLDDLGINLKPARAMGMTTIKVGDPAAAIAELEAVVGLSLR